ncbi:MAG: hypothetical protein Q9224_002000, partial [Gallowayella concinna]
MGDVRSRRVDNALSTLIELLVPASTDEDAASLDERRDDALAQARDILDTVSVVPDDGHIADLIKQKFLRHGNGDTEKANRVSSLLSRLLEQPVLSHKGAVLSLLHHLAEEGSVDVNTLGSDTPRPDVGSLHRNRAGASDTSLQGSDRPPAFGDALSANTFPQLPTRAARPTQLSKPVANGEPRDLSRNGRMNASETHQDDDSTATNTAKPTETSLLHDIPFTLQGLSSTHLPFSSPTTLDLPPSLPLPVISLLHTLAEPSLLYRVLSGFVESRDEGLVGQSLRSAIGVELRSYLGLIATLEGEIRRAIATVNPNELRGGIGKAGVTLKRCVVWTREATMGLRLMSLMAEEAKSRKGGQLITMIHSFSSSHGDPFVAAFAERMLVHVTRPFYDMLRQWIYNGELSDPYHEFFVHKESSQHDGAGLVDPRRAPATSVWEDKYKLETIMIPSIITEEFARKVFLIGKSLNFIRYGCEDSVWVEAYCKNASRELQYGDTATLEMSIDEAYKTTMARLIDLMDNKFQLFEHLKALKKYLFLGQGDFIVLLMESLASSLDRPAGSQYRHTLTAQLEYAIRGSNAQYDSAEVLRRLDARLLNEESHGKIGWDVFTLEYKVDAPVDVVITPWANKQYLAVFSYLWRIKRVEFALGSTWRRCKTGARGVLATIDDNQSKDWKSARCCIAEMIHFVNQLQYYILFEVIEASWNQLQAAITKPGATLDDLIGAHTVYLKTITHKALLGSARSSITGPRDDGFKLQLHNILKTMLAYKDVVDGLYSFSVAEFTRRQEQNARHETGTTKGRGGPTNEDDFRPPSRNVVATTKNLLNPADNNNFNRPDSPFPISTGALAVTSSADSNDSILSALRQRLGDLSMDFRERVNVLLGDLLVQPDADMKFLAVVMNFNDVYSPRKKRRERLGKTPGTMTMTETEREKEREGGREKAKGKEVDKKKEMGMDKERD